MVIILLNKVKRANCLYIIKDGEVDCVNKGNHIRTLTKGDFFGEKALLIDGVREMDIIAKTKCIVYSISVETLRRMVGEEYRNILYLGFIKISLNYSENFKNLNSKIIDKFFPCFKAISIGNQVVAYNIRHNKSSKLTIIIESNLLNSET
jgi:hypothetical protein